jgi:ElaB/YqjD/DUF883 family membrane-anchored ribosome-binding protein
MRRRAAPLRRVATIKSHGNAEHGFPPAPQARPVFLSPGADLAVGPVGAFLSVPFLILGLVIVRHLFGADQANAGNPQMNFLSERALNGVSLLGCNGVHQDATATVEDIQRDMQALRDDLAKLAGQVGDLVSAGGAEALSGLKKRARRMQDDLDETVADAGERGREALSGVSEHLSEVLQESMQEHHLTIVALAVGMGFLFGTAWRR